jgi:oligopeptide/dipeptide ABC transporter ATP-binding protein
MTASLVRVENLKKYYPVNGKSIHSVDDVSLQIQAGEIFGVVGESGCGKSTLGRCMLRLTDITGGKVYFQNEDITHLGQSALKKKRRYMQMVFQNPFSSFNPKMSIGQSLREVGTVHSLTKDEIDHKISQLLEYISLPHDVLQRRPDELSGGQLQRLAIARSLLLEPQFIMADEPVSALDVSVQAQILNLLMDLRDKLGLTMMFISHELTIVEYLCDEVAVMYLGGVVEKASAKELFAHTLHPYSQALISAKPKEHPAQQKSRIILEGDVPNALDIPRGCRFASRCFQCRKGLCDVESPKLKEVAAGHFVACHLV